MKNEFSELNYSKIVNDLWRFRRMSGPGNEGIQDFDTPGQFFFKILFDFDDNDDDANGLLGLQNIDFGSNEPINLNNSPIPQNFGPSMNFFREFDGTHKRPVYADTAFNFLLLNNELTRANYLKQFIKLLSEINTNSPWYWQSISGLDTILERSMFGPEFKISEERKKITIKCLPDAYDTRIGTLLDLYRAICYSYSQKKEILPSNLRKFDMSIYIFHTPVGNLHDIHDPRMLSGDVHPEKNSYLFNESGEFISNTNIGFAHNDKKSYTSSKIIELHNCEIDINSVKSGMSEISNADGFGIEYSIDIFCDDAWENRYNEFMGWNVGDFLYVDMARNVMKIEQESSGSGSGSDAYGNQDMGLISYGEEQSEFEKRTDISSTYYKDEDYEQKNGSYTHLGSYNVRDMGKMNGGTNYEPTPEPVGDNIYGSGGFRGGLGKISSMGGGLVGKAINAAAEATGVNAALSKFRSSLLGNIYAFPLGGIGAAIKDPVGTAKAMASQGVQALLDKALGKEAKNAPNRKTSLGQSLEDTVAGVLPKYKDGAVLNGWSEHGGHVSPYNGDGNVYDRSTYEQKRAELLGKYKQNQNIFRNI